MDFVLALRKALPIQSQWAFVLVVALGSAVVGGFLAWVIDQQWRNSSEYKAEHADPKPQAAAVKSSDSPAAASKREPQAPASSRSMASPPSQSAQTRGANSISGNISQSGGSNNNAAVGNDNFQNSGTIAPVVAPCGVAQIGNRNTATVNCGPPSGSELAKFGSGTVVRIVRNAGSSPTPIATGFWLNNRGYIATCLHSLKGTGVAAEVPVPPLLGESLTMSSGSVTTSVEPVILDDAADIAILRVLNSPFERRMHGVALAIKTDEQGRNAGEPEITQERYWVPTLAEVLAHDGDDIIKVGFVEQDKMSVVSYAFGHVTRMGVDPSAQKKSHRVFTSFSSEDSDCGAPIINNAKTVVGMMHGSDGNAIPSEYIVELLKAAH